jgi:hypothetical protein
MINDAVAKLRAIEEKLTQKTLSQLQTRLAIRGCLKELRDITAEASASPRASAH